MTDIKDIKDIEKSKKDGRILSFILKKSERLSSALYLLTGLMSETEPLRQELRKKAVQILSDIHAADARRFLDRAELLGSVIHSIDSAKALLSVAETSALLSDMNVAIVTRELGVLKAALETWGDLKQLDGGFTLAPEFFLGEMPQIPVAPRRPEAPISQSSSFPGDTSDSKRLDPIPSVSSEERRKAIVSYLKDHPDATIKDIREGSRLGADLSEKTVQRELVTLVLDGVVQRVGERRWSRYSLR